MKNDMATELRPLRISRDAKDLKRVIKQIGHSFNPFETELEMTASAYRLFNINTGKAASGGVQECLFNSPENGQLRHREFPVLHKQCRQI